MFECAGLLERMPTKADMSRSPFAEWLVSARTSRGWSQGDVAAHANSDLTQGYVSSLERDVRRPSREMVQTLATALFAGSGSREYTRFENAALKAAGYTPINDDGSESRFLDDWPDDVRHPLDEALSYMGGKTFSPEARVRMAEIWRDMAKMTAALAEMPVDAAKTVQKDSSKSG